MLVVIGRVHSLKASRITSQEINALAKSDRLSGLSLIMSRNSTLTLAHCVDIIPVLKPELTSLSLRFFVLQPQRFSWRSKTLTSLCLSDVQVLDTYANNPDALPELEMPSLRHVELNADVIQQFLPSIVSCGELSFLKVASLRSAEFEFGSKIQQEDFRFQIGIASNQMNLWPRLYYLELSTCVHQAFVELLTRCVMLETLTITVPWNTNPAIINLLLCKLPRLRYLLLASTSSRTQMTERIIPISQTYDRCVSAPSLLTISVEIPLDTAYITMPNVFECTLYAGTRMRISSGELARSMPRLRELTLRNFEIDESKGTGCLLYTSPSPRD